MEVTPKIFESHAHYDAEQFNEDRNELLAGMAEAGVETIVNIAADLEGCKSSVELAGEYDFIYATVGVHPDRVDELNEDTFKWMSDLADSPKVVAIGEIGLDYYWDKVDRGVQKKWFIDQLNLAREKQLPIVIHSREATQDTLEIIKEHGRDLTGVVHCFSGSAEVAMEYVKMGYYIGVGGVVTFKNGKKLREVVEAVPLESILLETDCPYLSPEPNRGKRNDSRNIEYIAKEVASVKRITYEEVLEVTNRSGKEMYGI